MADTDVLDPFVAGEEEALSFQFSVFSFKRTASFFIFNF